MFGCHADQVWRHFRANHERLKSFYYIYVRSAVEHNGWLFEGHENIGVSVMVNNAVKVALVDDMQRRVDEHKNG